MSLQLALLGLFARGLFFPGGALFADLPLLGLGLVEAVRRSAGYLPRQSGGRSQVQRCVHAVLATCSRNSGLEALKALLG